MGFNACNTQTSTLPEETDVESLTAEDTIEMVEEEIPETPDSSLMALHHSAAAMQDAEEGDTLAVRSFSVASEEMKKLEDYQPNEKGVYDINWLTLTDVKFEEKIAPEDSALYLYPTFGKIVKSLNGKKVSIKGFIIPIDVAEHFYVLSANPYSACFFCGKAGPESIMELELKSDPNKAYEMDMFTTFEGIFQINGTDIDHCNYILKEAVLVEEE